MSGVGPVGIISVLIISAVTLLIGAIVLGNVDNVFSCSTINNTNGQSACTQTKTIMWNVYQIVPITLLFLILGIFGIARARQ